MTVVSGHRAENFHLVQPAPRRVIKDTVDHGTVDRVIHNIQAGVAVDNDIFRLRADHSRDQLLRRLDPVQDTVVSDIRAETAPKNRVASQHIHHGLGQIQLFFGRLASGHIQLQAERADLTVLLL